MPPELLDEMEALYAPPDHPVFQLVPPIFHERATELYLAIGQPELNIDTFWNVYRNLLNMLRGQRDDQLTNSLTSYEAEVDSAPTDLPLLPNMEPFRLGRPLNIGGRSDYIGGIGTSNFEDVDDEVDGREYAPLTPSDDQSGGDEGDDEW